MNVRIHPRRLSGSVTVPPSKSQAHRLLLAAALATGPGQVSRLDLSNDIRATLDGLAALGCRSRLLPEPGCTTVTAFIDTPCTPNIPLSQILQTSQISQLSQISQTSPDSLPNFDCGESGSTLRFLIPIAVAVAGGGIFTGSPRLMERPQEPYMDLFREKGVACSLSDGTLRVCGTLPAGTYRLRGDVSSQFVTGLLYALALVPGASTIELTSPLESRGYVDMTLDVLTACGVPVRETESPHPHEGPSFSLPDTTAFAPRATEVEGDWSQAGFFYAAQGLGNAITLHGLNLASRQGDRVIADLAVHLAGCGAGDVVIDVSQCPDLVPALAVWAALRDGETTRIVNAARLRIKESDRLDAVTRELSTLGATITQSPDSLTIHGVRELRGGDVSSHNDHRIAMMLAMAATRALTPVTLSGAGAVRKSYPRFWDDYASLGGVVEWL